MCFYRDRCRQYKKRLEYVMNIKRVLFSRTEWYTPSPPHRRERPPSLAYAEGIRVHDHGCLGCRSTWKRGQLSSLHRQFAQQPRGRKQTRGFRPEEAEIERGRQGRSEMPEVRKVSVESW